MTTPETRTWTVHLTDADLAEDFAERTELLFGDLGVDTAGIDAPGYTGRWRRVTLPSGLKLAVCEMRRLP